MTKILKGIGVVLVIIASVLIAQKISRMDARPDIVSVAQALGVSLPEATAITGDVISPAQPNESQTETLLPTATPMPILVQNYALGKVDLASGKSIAMTINLPDGSLLLSNWAKAVAYNGNDPKSIFQPTNGVVYSYEDGGVPVTWAHSGMLTASQRLFATNLDLYLRKGLGGSVLPMFQSQALAARLIGTGVVLCQDDSGTIKPMSNFDPAGGCKGQKVTLQLVALTIVPHDLVAEYDTKSMGIIKWMAEKFPGDGYDNLPPQDSWVIRFCIGKLSDQVSDGTPPNLYNRGVIAFRVLK